VIQLCNFSFHHANHQCYLWLFASTESIIISREYVIFEAQLLIDLVDVIRTDK
jgi:hypothetical protein